MSPQQIARIYTTWSQTKPHDAASGAVRSSPVLGTLRCRGPCSISAVAFTASSIAFSISPLVSIPNKLGGQLCDERACDFLRATSSDGKQERRRGAQGDRLRRCLLLLFGNLPCTGIGPSRASGVMRNTWGDMLGCSWRGYHECVWHLQPHAREAPEVEIARDAAKVTRVPWISGRVHPGASTCAPPTISVRWCGWPAKRNSWASTRQGLGCNRHPITNVNEVEAVGHGDVGEAARPPISGDGGDTGASSGMSMSTMSHTRSPVDGV